MRRAAMMAALVLAAGCERSIISGMAVTVDGEALPGVAVTSDRGETLTDGLGRFRLPYRPGEVTIEFMKSGYAPAQRKAVFAEGGPRTLEPVALWLLPPGAGVFLEQNRQYVALTRDVPEEVFLESGKNSWGVRRTPRTATENPRPRLFCFKTPRYDVRLTRLELQRAKLGRGGGGDYDTWTPTETLRVSAEAVDDYQGLLREIVLEQPLTPGKYAIHWGAFEGFTSIDERAYLFEVVAEAEETAEAEESAEVK